MAAREKASKPTQDLRKQARMASSAMGGAVSPMGPALAVSLLGAGGRPGLLASRAAALAVQRSMGNQALQRLLALPTHRASILKELDSDGRASEAEESRDGEPAQTGERAADRAEVQEGEAGEGRSEREADGLAGQAAGGGHAAAARNGAAVGAGGPAPAGAARGHEGAGGNGRAAKQRKAVQRAGGQKQESKLAKAGKVAKGVFKGLGKGLAEQAAGVFSYLWNWRDKRDDWKKAYQERLAYGSNWWNKLEGRLNQFAMFSNEIAAIAGWLSLVLGIIGLFVPPVLAAASVTAFIALIATSVVGAFKLILLLKDLFVWVKSKVPEEIKAAKNAALKNFLGFLGAAIGVVSAGAGSAAGGESFGKGFQVDMSGQAAESLGEGVSALAAGTATGMGMGSATGMVEGGIEEAGPAEDEDAQAKDSLKKIGEAATDAKQQAQDEKQTAAEQQKKAEAAKPGLDQANGKLNEITSQPSIDDKAKEAQGQVEAGEQESKAKGDKKPSEDEVKQTKAMNQKLDEVEAKTGEKLGEKPQEPEEKPSFFGWLKSWWKKAKAFFSRVFGRLFGVFGKIKSKIANIAAKALAPKEVIAETSQVTQEGKTSVDLEVAQAAETKETSDKVASGSEELAKAAQKVLATAGAK